MYVRLTTWISHPFLFNAFKIKDEEQLTALRSLGLTEVVYVPAKSDTQPLPASSPAAPPAELPIIDLGVAEMWREKLARREKIVQRRTLINHCERRLQQGVTTLKSLLGHFFSRPRAVVDFARDMVSDMTASLLDEKDALIHVVNVKEGDESAQFHAMNVTALALLLGREAGLSRQELHDLGLGTLLHDIGKSEVPSRVLLKRGPWTPAERGAYEQHVAFGVAMAEKLPGLPAGARAVIAMHHEMLDGSGFPKKLRGEAIPRLARIAAIANTYDNMCNRVVAEESLTPAEALAHMYKHQRAQLDAALLQLFVRCLGVYPPGSIVQLNNEMLGIVTGSSKKHLLQPTILVYDAQVPKDEAVFFDLDDEPDLKIVRTLRPGILPKEIQDYLNPRAHIGYEGKA
jgi:HD-GYP domain-containing protein (c-di-GMP phosphodiesterase class II)